MSDDLGKKIQQIAEMLGQDTVPDNVKELVTLLAGSLKTKEPAEEAVPVTSESVVADESDKAAEAEPNGAAGNSDLMDAARKALEHMNTASDPRINLLHAIKPFMNSRRQKKIGNCIQLLQVASLSNLLNDQGKKPHNNAR